MKVSPAPTVSTTVVGKPCTAVLVAFRVDGDRAARARA